MICKFSQRLWGSVLQPFTVSGSMGAFVRSLIDGFIPTRKK